MLSVSKYRQTCQQRSAMGNYKGGHCWHVDFVRSVRNYHQIVTGHIKTDLCGPRTTTRRCPYAQVWLYSIADLY